jgi:GT2 family glycosyltransferase
MTRCSVIIPVFNLATVTRQCLDHLLDDQPARCDWELIVVDDASRDNTADVLQAYGNSIRVVTHRENTGFATACNDGARAATGDLVVFLNNDTIPLSGWLDALVAYAGAHPRAHIVGSKLLYPDGTVQHAGIAIDHDRQPRHIYVGFPGDHPAVNRPRPVQMVTGGCFLISTELFRALGGFDAAYENGFEDVDLCMRVRAGGGEVHYCPASTLVHLESISERVSDHDGPNRRLFHERWRDRLEVDDWRYYLDDGLVRITYPGTVYCPLQFTVSPLLGVVDEPERRSESDRLLDQRARQVRDLLKENIHLRIERPATARTA